MNAAQYNPAPDLSRMVIPRQRTGGRDIWELPDGRTLQSPEPATPQAVSIGMWVKVSDRPWRVADLRARTGGGRLLILEGRPIYPLASGDSIPVYAITLAARPRQG